MNRDFALARFEALFGPEFGHGKTLSTTRLTAALSTLDNPQKRLPPVIHVAGTNGKGSTIAFLRAIVETSGRRAHVFTKPHLHSLHERFVVAGREVDDARLIDVAARVWRATPDLTQFEAQVACALLLFSECPADFALIETGMGGRDDATNIFEAPAASVLTPIGLDHIDVLGESLAEIATHKAGIIKAGAPVICARQPVAARDVIEREASRVDAPLFLAGRDWDAFARAGGLVVETETRSLHLPAPALAGGHQIDNAGLAVASLLFAAPFELDDDAVANGVTQARWPGRLTPLTRGEMSAPVRAIGGEVWVDGGHNGHAGAALAAWLHAQNAKRPAPFVLVFVARARKDWRAMLEALAPHAALVLALDLALDLGAHGEAPAHIAKAAAALGIQAKVEATLESAMQSAALLPAPRVLITGSLLLAAKALSLD